MEVPYFDTTVLRELFNRARVVLFVAIGLSVIPPQVLAQDSGCASLMARLAHHDGVSEWTTIRLDREEVMHLWRVMGEDEDFRYFRKNFLQSWQRRVKSYPDASEIPLPHELVIFSFYQIESGYRHSPYLALNHWLRTGELLEGYDADVLHAMAKLLASSLNKMPDSQLVRNKKVYRGLSLPSSVVDGAQYSPGAILKERSFISSSLDIQVADDFSFGSIDNERVIFHIKSKSGKRVSDFLKKRVRADSEEQEVLFLPETRFLIISNEVDLSQNRRVIELVEL